MHFNQSQYFNHNYDTDCYEVGHSQWRNLGIIVRVCLK